MCASLEWKVGLEQMAGWSRGDGGLVKRGWRVGLEGMSGWSRGDGGLVWWVGLEGTSGWSRGYLHAAPKESVY